VGVEVAAAIGVGVAVSVGVGVAVSVGVAVGVSVSVGVDVIVTVTTTTFPATDDSGGGEPALRTANRIRSTSPEAIKNSATLRPLRFMPASISGQSSLQGAV